MTNSFEEISKSIASQNGKTDANLANDALHLGGIPAEEYATKAWVRAYHGDMESVLRKYIDQQDAAMLSAAKEYTNAAIRNQDFSGFAELADLQALSKNLTDKINADIAGQKAYTDQKTQAIVDDVNANFADVEDAIDQLNDNMNDLFQSVSDGKELIAEAITDKGVTTSANASFSTMANNIRNINTSEPIDPGEIIVIPPGYIDTSDATAGPDQILQGYTAYANGNKLHGTYVPSGGGSTGGVILGEDEVVAKKIYGEAGVLTGNKLDVEGFDLNINSDASNAITLVGDDYVVADRKLAENISGEIVIYNINKEKIYHAEPSSKFSYTYEELGLQGEVKCIAASPITVKASDNQRYTQITIGTSAKIYTYMFKHSGNGAIGVTTPFSTVQKIVIDSPVNDHNSIAYANTNSNTFAYFATGNVHIVKMYWAVGLAVETLNENAQLSYSNVQALFRFSPSDRFFMYADWGHLNLIETHVMLLDDYYYIADQIFTLDTGSTYYQHGQVLINSQDNFAILFGNPCSITYDLAAKTFEFTRLSNNKVIPYNNGYNESYYAVFSKDDKYVYAVSFQGAGYSLGCYKVDLLNLETQWQLVSTLLPVSGNGYMPTIDSVNNRIFCLDRGGGNGFYYYWADPNVKEIIGLQYNGETYQRLIR